MSGDRYLTVRVRIKEVRPTSVLFWHGDTTTWVPRSCLFGPDDSAIDNVAIDSEVTLRVREWIAEREGLI
jgi:hypothetical protein